MLEGACDRVESMLHWCRRGPAGARVDDVEVVWEPPLGETAFRVG